MFDINSCAWPFGMANDCYHIVNIENNNDNWMTINKIITTKPIIIIRTAKWIL